LNRLVTMSTGIYIYTAVFQDIKIRYVIIIIMIIIIIVILIIKTFINEMYEIN